MWDGGGAVCCAHPFYFPNLLLLCVLVHRELFHDHSERYPFSVSSFVIVNGLALFSFWHVQMRMEFISCMVAVTLTELLFL